MSAQRIGILRRKYFGTRTSLILTSIVIGLLAALGAVLLKNGVAIIQNSVENISVKTNRQYLIFFFPVIGIVLTVFYTRVFHGGNLKRGVTSIIYSISRRSSAI